MWICINWGLFFRTNFASYTVIFFFDNLSYIFLNWRRISSKLRSISDEFNINNDNTYANLLFLSTKKGKISMYHKNQPFYKILYIDKLTACCIICKKLNLCIYIGLKAICMYIHINLKKVITECVFDDVINHKSPLSALQWLIISTLIESTSYETFSVDQVMYTNSYTNTPTPWPKGVLW